MSKRITNVKKAANPKKILAIVAVALVAVLMVGVVTVYTLSENGFFHRTKVAMKSDNYTVSSAMMNYYYSTLYQNTSGSYAQLGLDTSKDLKSQAYPGGGTWHDFYLNMTKDNVKQLLVLCEAAKAAGFKLEDDNSHDHSADAVLKEIESMASMYNVSLSYYLEATYGKGVNESVFRKCYEISELASHYSEKMTGSYNFADADWEKYYSENKKTFDKVDYLSFTFDVDDYKLDKNATDEEKKTLAARLEQYATEMLAAKTEEDFNRFVEDYLVNDLYAEEKDEEADTEADTEAGADAEAGANESTDAEAGADAAKAADTKTETKDDDAKTEEDIKAEVEDCLTKGATNSAKTDLNDWLFNEETKAYEVKLIKAEDGMSFTVAMILPAENTDLEDDCLYRDTYNLKNFRYIPFTNSSFKNSAKEANDAAVAALNSYKDNATEDNFAKMADEYATTSYAGGLVENVDKGSLGDEVDAWLYDSARKKGDCDVIQVPDKGSYLIYYLGDGDVKWESQADSALINAKYQADYDALAAKYTVKEMQSGLNAVGITVQA